MGRFVKAFEEMTKKDIQEAGGKAANLGELTQNNFNVPPGFCQRLLLGWVDWSTRL